MAQILLTTLVLASLFYHSYQLGGWQKVSVTDPRVQKAGEFAVERISDSMEDSLYALKLIRMNSIYYQIVAGINYRIVVDAGLTSCRKGTHYQLSTCQFNTNVTENSAVKCSVTVYLDLTGKYHLSKSKCTNTTLEAALDKSFEAPVNAGGWESTSTDDQGVQEASKYGVKILSEENDSKYSLKMVGISSAERQVVAGLNYKVTVTAALTTCMKTEQVVLSECQYNTKKNVAYKCVFQVYRDLKNQLSLSKKNCVTTTLDAVLVKPPTNSAVPLPGGWESASTDDQGVQEVSNYGVKILSEEEDSKYSLKMVGISSAERQVVAGLNYKVTVTAAFTTCLKTEQVVLSECQYNTKKNVAYKCVFQVYRDLKNQLSLTKKNCVATTLDAVLVKPPTNSAVPLPGGWESASTDDQGVQEASNYGVKILSEEEDSKYSLKMVGISSAERQVVAGLNYKVTVTAAFTTCLKTEQNCVATTLDAVLVKPPTNSAVPLRGGWETVTDDNKYVQEAARFGVNRISVETNSMYTLKLARVSSAQQQVVAGMNYKMTVYAGFTTCWKGKKVDSSLCGWNSDLKNGMKCDIVVYRNLKQQYSLSQNDCHTTTLKDVLEESSEMRAMPMSGGWATVSKNNKYVQSAATFVVNKISDGTNSMYKMKLAGISSAQEQVVAGMNYKMTVYAAFTMCRKGKETDLSQCRWNTNMKDGALKCEIEIYQDLKQQMSLTKRSCLPTTLGDVLSNFGAVEAAPMLGGWMKINTSDSRVQRLAKFAVSQISLRSDSLYRHKFIEVKQAEYQVVSGLKYRFVIEYGLTNCLKISEIASPCNLQNKNNVNRCTIEVLSQPWMSVIKVNEPTDCQKVSVQ
ncbi:Kininogen-1 [Nymphon striatum]|nr:Kininogen-1 [Nymphon striatum]